MCVCVCVCELVWHHRDGDGDRICLFYYSVSLNFSNCGLIPFVDLFFKLEIIFQYKYSLESNIANKIIYNHFQTQATC